MNCAIVLKKENNKKQQKTKTSPVTKIMNRHIKFKRFVKIWADVLIDNLYITR